MQIFSSQLATPMGLPGDIQLTVLLCLFIPCPRRTWAAGQSSSDIRDSATHYPQRHFPSYSAAVCSLLRRTSVAAIYTNLSWARWGRAVTREMFGTIRASFL